MANVGDIWYRYEDVPVQSNSDDFGFTTAPPKVQVVLRKLPITRKTPKCVWVNYGGKDKQIRVEAAKRFAHPTPIQALEGFVARKQSQVTVFKMRLARAQHALVIGTQELNRVMFGG